MSDLISRQAAIDAFTCDGSFFVYGADACKAIVSRIKQIPAAESEIIHCRECKHWIRQTNYAGKPLSFGFCESDDMWRSLCGERDEIEHIDTDDDFYCGFAERRKGEQNEAD